MSSADSEGDRNELFKRISILEQSEAKNTAMLNALNDTVISLNSTFTHKFEMLSNQITSMIKPNVTNWIAVVAIIVTVGGGLLAAFVSHISNGHPGAVERNVRVNAESIKWLLDGHVEMIRKLESHGRDIYWMDKMMQERSAERWYRREGEENRDRINRLEENILGANEHDS